MEEWNARAQQNRVNVQSNFIDQVRFKQTSCELAAAEQANAFAFLTLQFTNELRCVLRDKLDVLIGLVLARQSFSNCRVLMDQVLMRPVG